MSNKVETIKPKADDKRKAQLKKFALDFLNTRFPATDGNIDIEVSRLALANEAITGNEGLKKAASDDKTRDLALNAVFEAIGEFFTARGYHEVSVKMRHTARAEKAQQEKAAAANAEAIRLKALVRDSVKEALVEMGIVPQPPKVQ